MSLQLKPPLSPDELLTKRGAGAPYRSYLRGHVEITALSLSAIRLAQAEPSDSINSQQMGRTAPRGISVP